jgi:Zn-dependent protease
MNIWILRQFQADPEFAVMEVLIIVFSVCCHEYMHARAALWQGDDTAALMGHLTLNPLKQMGPFSIVLLAVAGIAFGSVPVNPARLRRPYGEAWVAFAGPATNLALAAVFVLTCAGVGNFAPSSNGAQFALRVLFFGALINMVLFILNMIPVPPLDGYGIVKVFFPGLGGGNSEFMNGAMFFILIVLFFSAEYLFLAANSIVRFALEIFGIQLA